MEAPPIVDSALARTAGHLLVHLERVARLMILTTFLRMAAKMFSLASCGTFSLDSTRSVRLTHRYTVMLFYDIVLTFGDEVEKVWRKKFTPVTFLWFMVSLIPYIHSAMITLITELSTYRIAIYHP